MSSVMASDFYTVLVEELADDASLVTLLGGVQIFDMTAPENTEGHYIIIQSPTEEDIRKFDAGAGNTLSLIFLIVTRTDGYVASDVGRTIYGHLKRILDGRRLVVAGFTFVTGRARLLPGFPDPDGVHARTPVLYEAIGA